MTTDGAQASQTLLGTQAAVGSATSSGQSRLVTYLTDRPAPSVSELWVLVTSVTAHSSGGGWATLVPQQDPPVPVNLLALQGVTSLLGTAVLPPGEVTQIRLLVAQEGNYVIAGGQQVPLKVPSGYESGIKIHGPWQLEACSETALTLDFDGAASIAYHPTGHGDEWILRPVIRVKDVSHRPVTCDGDGGTPGGGTVTPPACGPSLPACSAQQACVSGSCLGVPGERCADASTCSSAYCDVTGFCGQGGTGAPCSTGLECLSGTCSSEARCVAGAADRPCRLNGDCASGTCTGGACAAGSAAGAGHACTSATDCLSGICSSTTSTCEPGVDESACAANTDCVSGYCSLGAGATLGYCLTRPQ